MSNPWPNGADPDTGMYRILAIGINRSGIDAGEIDYSINVAAVERMVETGRVHELLRCIDSLKNSCTISDAIAKQKLLDALEPGGQPS